MSIFGWSYPPGCSGPPEYPEEPDKFKCSKCGRFISPKTIEYIPVTAVGKNFWGEEEVYEVGEKIFATCKRCGRVENPVALYTYL